MSLASVAMNASCASAFDTDDVHLVDLKSADIRQRIPLPRNPDIRSVIDAIAYSNDGTRIAISSHKMATHKKVLLLTLITLAGCSAVSSSEEPWMTIESSSLDNAPVPPENPLELTDLPTEMQLHILSMAGLDAARKSGYFAQLADDSTRLRSQFAEEAAMSRGYYEELYKKTATDLGGTIEAVELSPNGETIAVAILPSPFTFHQIALIDRQTGHERARHALMSANVQNHGISNLVFSPNGKQVAASFDGISDIEVVHIESGTITSDDATELPNSAQFLFDNSEVITLSGLATFSSDGRYGARALSDGSVRIIDFGEAPHHRSPGQEAPEHTLKANWSRLSFWSKKPKVRALAFAPRQDRRIAAVYADGSVHLWNLHEPLPIRVLRNHGERIITGGPKPRSLTFAPSGSLVVGWSHGWYHALNTDDDGPPVYSFVENVVQTESSRGRARFSRAGDYMVVPCSSTLLSVRAVRKFPLTPRSTDTQSAAPSLVSAAAWSDYSFDTPGRNVALKFSHDGTKFAVLTYSEIVLADLSSRQTRVIPLQASAFLTAVDLNRHHAALAFSANDRELIAGIPGQEAHITRYETDTGNPIGKVYKFRPVFDPTSLANYLLDSSGTKLAFFDKSEQLSIWRIASEVRRNVVAAHRSEDRLVSWRERSLAVIHRDNSVSVFDIETGKEKRFSSPSQTWTSSAALSPSGDQLAIVRPYRLQNSVEICDVGTEKRLKSIAARSLRKVVYLPDGKRIATTSRIASRAYVRLFDVQSGEEPAVYLPFDNLALGPVFSEDGTKLALATANRVTILEVRQ